MKTAEKMKIPNGSKLFNLNMWSFQRTQVNMIFFNQLKWKPAFFYGDICAYTILNFDHHNFYPFLAMTAKNICKLADESKSSKILLLRSGKFVTSCTFKWSKKIIASLLCIENLLTKK